MIVHWFARCPTPYRYPIWEATHRRAGLEVSFFRERGRNRVWARQEASFPQHLMASLAVPYQEDALYVLPPLWHRSINRSDVVVLQGMWESPAAWQIARFSRREGIPFIYFHESTAMSHRHPGGTVAQLRSRFLAGADAILTSGTAATRSAMAAGVPAIRIVTSFNIVDVEKYRAGAWALRNSRDDEAIHGHRFLIVAQLIPRKNISTAIRAFARIAGPGDSLTIAGDGPLGQSLKHEVASLNLESNVSFTGHVGEGAIIELLARHQTLILPSTDEVWGLAVNEALAAGLQVVISSRCGVAPSVSHMHGVYISEPTEDGLSGGMQASRSAWSGWVRNPEMMNFDAEFFTDDLFSAITVAQSARGK